MIDIAGNQKPKELTKKFEKILARGEEISSGFKTIRDTFIFTNMRLILVDVQRVTGHKKEYLSIPYSKITMFSVESSFIVWVLKIWVGSNLEPIKREFHSDANIYDLQKLLTEATCLE